MWTSSAQRKNGSVTFGEQGLGSTLEIKDW